MKTTLPKTIRIRDEDLSIRWDYRDALDIIDMLGDPDLSRIDKGEALLTMFYEDPEQIRPEEIGEAIKGCFSFLDGGSHADGKPAPRLVDWEQDFNYIVAPVNRVLGRDIREETPLHWWTFLSAYMEIGPDCVFSQVVSIRDKLARGKKLEKYERDWYNRNKRIVTLGHRYSDAENDLINDWIKGGESK